MDLVKASLSPEGYERVTEAMALNGFLGELVDLPKVMNEHSYWFSLFGAPGLEAPWAGSCSVTTWRSTSSRSAAGTSSPRSFSRRTGSFRRSSAALRDREQIALQLAGSFTPGQHAKAVVFESVLDPKMPEGRLHPADERHVAGAFRDNRVVPYEGIPVAEFTQEQRDLLRQVVADFLLLLNERQRPSPWPSTTRIWRTPGSPGTGRPTVPSRSTCGSRAR